MFDENTNIDQDLMMRSILEGAEEEVPAGVWEGVSAGLDRKARMLWWRRVGIGVTAAAAAVAAVLLVLPGESSMDIVPDSEDLIAVVESEPAVGTPENVTDPTTTQQAAYIAQAGLTTQAAHAVHTARTAKSAMKHETVPSEIVTPEDIYSCQTEETASFADAKDAAEETEVAVTKTPETEVKEEWHYYDDLSALEGQLIDPVRTHRNKCSSKREHQEHIQKSGAPVWSDQNWNKADKHQLDLRHSAFIRSRSQSGTLP